LECFRVINELNSHAKASMENGGIVDVPKPRGELEWRTNVVQQIVDAFERFQRARDNLAYAWSMHLSRERTLHEISRVLELEEHLRDYVEELFEKRIPVEIQTSESILNSVLYKRTRITGPNQLTASRIWGRLDEHYLAREKRTEENLGRLRDALNE